MFNVVLLLMLFLVLAEGRVQGEMGEFSVKNSGPLGVKRGQVT